MLQKQNSNASSDSDDNYSFGSGRRKKRSNAASTSAGTTSGFEGPMILKPGPEYSDILLQEIARLSEQQRREVANTSSNAPSTSGFNHNRFAAGPSTSSQNNNGQEDEQPSTSSTSKNHNQNLDLTAIASQYNTNSILPLRLSSDQIGSMEHKKSLSDVISRVHLSRSEPQETQPIQFNNHDFSYPMMLQRDSNSSCLAEFSIGSQKVVGFTVGGEPRLCLPQLKALILPEYNGLDNLMSRLEIATVNATNEQLNQLIQANALPKTISYCPLITRSNAERVINYCVIKGIRPLIGIGNTDNFMDAGVRMALQNEAIHIEHFCFGGQPGIYYPSLLSGSCIECTSCQRLFQPPEFVRHSHAVNDAENKVCDWGFDSANWKFYISLSEETEPTDEAEERLRQLLSFAYDPTMPSNSMSGQGIQPNQMQSIGLGNSEIVGQS